MRELFVYYRVRAAEAEAAFAFVRELHARLALEHPGLHGRLLRRPEEPDGPQTWMETFAVDPRQAPNGVDTDLQSAIEAAAAPLLPLIDGARHTEAFVACA